MKVQDAMMRTPAYCNADMNLGSAVELLWMHNCGFLPVVDANKRVTGVVTDRDLCMAMGTQNRLPGQIMVSEVATKDVRSCREEDDIRTALQTMAKWRIRRLPVVNQDGILEGILSMDNVILHTGRAGVGQQAEPSNDEVVDTMRRIYGLQVPQVVEARSARA